MTVSPAQKTSTPPSRKAWIMSGLAVFLVIDIVLVTLALGAGRGQPESAGSESTTENSSAPMEASASAESPDASEPTDSPEESEGEDENSESASESGNADTPRLLSVVSETIAWRADGGACDEVGSLELTLDGGDSWGSAFPEAEELGHPLWVSGSDFATVQAAVASGADCDATGFITADSGASWVQDDQAVVASVFVDPTDAGVLVWGGEAFEGPCDSMLRVAGTAGLASTVCEDGAVWTGDPVSGTWAETGIENGLTVSGSNGQWIAAVESEDCEGVALQEFPGESVDELACADGASREDVALSFEGETLWLWAGDEVFISSDAGVSFPS